MMKALLDTLVKYVQQILGVDLHPVPWAGQNRLPFLLRDRYRFYRVQVLENDCLLMVDVGSEEQSPAAIRKHIDSVWAHTQEAPLIYVRDRITPYNRKRLIEHKVPFVVPGNQMYLPMLGLDLREHFRKLRAAPPEFSPATQVVVLYWLLQGKDEPLTPAVMAQRLGYSRMSMTRAFDELENAGLGEFFTRGRERCVVFPESKRELWLKAQAFLKNPVKWRHHVMTTHLPSLRVRAGLMALAHYTMLAEPTHTVFAMHLKEWNTLLAQHDLQVVPPHEPQAAEIQVWSYDPVLFAENGFADRLSVYLSLKGSEDERVEAALTEMLEELRW